MKKIDLERLSDILEVTVKISEKDKIWYIATAGTLLTAIRHKALMPRVKLLFTLNKIIFP